QRPVQVRPDSAPDTATFEAALAVVAEAGNDAAERLRSPVEMRAAGVVLEAGEHPPDPGFELALEQDVADHAPLTGDRLEREEADAREVDAVEVAVRTAEQLVAAADSEQCRAVGDRRQHVLGLGGQILRDKCLLTILTAADAQQVLRARA